MVVDDVDDRLHGVVRLVNFNRPVPQMFDTS